MTIYKTFQTKRLIIQPISIEDADFILELLNSPKWKKYIGDRNINSTEEAQQYISERMLPNLEKYGYSNNAVIRKEDNVKLGTCGLYKRDGLEVVDIGFAFLPQHEGKGYAYEAANKLTEAAHSDFNISELSGYTLEENTSSRKLLEKLGFSLIGKTFIPNDSEELLHYHKVLNQ